MTSLDLRGKKSYWNEICHTLVDFIHSLFHLNWNTRFLAWFPFNHIVFPSDLFVYFSTCYHSFRGRFAFACNTCLAWLTLWYPSDTFTSSVFPLRLRCSLPPLVNDNFAFIARQETNSKTLEWIEWYTNISDTCRHSIFVQDANKEESNCCKFNCYPQYYLLRDLKMISDSIRGCCFFNPVPKLIDIFRLIT